MSVGMLLDGLGNWVYQNLSVPIMLADQVVLTFLSLSFYHLGHWPDLALSIALFLPFPFGWYYSAGEFLRIEHESAPRFRRARAMIVGGFAAWMGTALFSYLSTIVLRAFNWTLPYADSVRLIRLSLNLCGTLVLGVGVLLVKGKGPPVAIVHNEEQPQSRIRRWTLGGVVSLVGLVMVAAGFFGGLFFPLQGVVLLVIGVPLLIFGQLMIKRRQGK